MPLRGPHSTSSRSRGYAMETMHRTPALLCLLLLVVVCLAACASDDDKEADFVISTPFALDPTDEYELASWWSNGNELLFLGDNGYYAVYATGNRHRPPTERKFRS